MAHEAKETASQRIPHPFDGVKLHIAQAVVAAASRAFGKDLQAVAPLLVDKFEAPKHGKGDLAVQCFHLMKDIKDALPKEKHPQGPGGLIAERIMAQLKDVRIEGVDRVVQEAAYLNFFLTVEFAARVIPMILGQNWLRRQPQEGKMRVMVEYSQPNTHKAFHVGHMRNAALGDCLVRLYEHIGHPVVAANYFGDEGAHIAKCLWYLRKYWLPTHQLSEVKVAERGEFLGDKYAKAVEALDLSAYTKYPYPGLLSAKVLSVEKHPAADAPANWHKVILQVGPGEKRVVVCGGDGYKEGDVVAYAPLGLRFNKKLIEPKDMKGVQSEGLIVGRAEVELPDPVPLPPSIHKQEAKEDGKKDKKGGKTEKKEGGSAAGKSPWIFVLPPDTDVGKELTELGRKNFAEANESAIPPPEITAEQKLVDVVTARNEEVKKVLRDMEEKEPEITKLWDETKEWSLSEFKRIYQWLHSRFDHDFFESEVSEESRKMVLEYFNQGKVLSKSEGAIGVDLSQYNLGYCILLKSDGSGLYATKDLALARRKFDQYHIDKSIYVVDVAQTLHFAQVFKVLELLGYEKAKNCFHLSYGTVVTPTGKMSSRKGTVILFSQLKALLYAKIYADYLEDYTIQRSWPQKEIEGALQAIAVGTIKYGMLNVDPAKDIVFDLQAWAAKTGNTGPYLMYGYTRVKKILREFPKKAEANYSLLDHDVEKSILLQLNSTWEAISDAATKNNPFFLCNFLYTLTQKLMSWYELNRSIKNAEDEVVRATRLDFIASIAEVLKVGLHLLGIEVLERM